MSAGIGGIFAAIGGIPADTSADFTESERTARLDRSRLR
jgi:hypothetical protein